MQIADGKETYSKGGEDSNAQSFAISIENLSHSYDGKKYVISDVSFNVNRGEIFGLLGPNGAGKTTTIKILTTLIQPSKGNVKILGFDLRKDGMKIRRRIGVVQQDSSFDFATVRQNLDLYGFLWGIPKEERTKRSIELIKMFGLEEVANQRAFDLSGGQQRRLQVAREFIHDMDLLFLDEPTVGLDPLMRRRILDLLKEKARKEGLTILFTTHNLEEADYLCDRVAIMDKGRLQALDTVERLKRIYGGTKAIEVILASSVLNSEIPIYDNFFRKLREVQVDVEVSKQPTDSEPAVIVSKHPEKVIEAIISVANEQRVKIEWLNVRKSTLEDVFIEAVAPSGSSEEVSSQGNAKESTTIAKSSTQGGGGTSANS